MASSGDTPLRASRVSPTPASRSTRPREDSGDDEAPEEQAEREECCESPVAFPSTRQDRDRDRERGERRQRQREESNADESAGICMFSSSCPACTI